MTPRSRGGEGEMTSKMELTRQEELAIELLKKAARHWPESLWLFSASGTLCVMKKDKAGKRAILKSSRLEGYDPEYLVGTIDIPNDGGDF